MENNTQENLRVGFHTIEILLKLSPENIKKIFIPSNRNDERVQNLVAMAEKFSVSVERKKSLAQHPEAILKNEVNLSLSDLKNYEESIQQNNPTFLVIDNVIDPRNLGACIRSAAASNIAGVIINKHHCAPINSIAHKVSVGGAEVIKIFHVTNLVNCLKYLQGININIYGLSEHASKSHTEYNFTEASAIIMGSEESGVREKTLERCDHKINLSSNKLFKSFNVSVATGIILSEASRQRRI